MAQTGLAFTRDGYDRERYERLRMVAAEMFNAYSEEPVERIVTLFSEQLGYTTPKIDVRAAVFDDQQRILMVRETADHGRWTLPGGWADVNLTPAENAVKEVREESGYIVETTKLAAAWDRSKQGHPASVFSCAKMYFVCRLIGGEATTSLETSEIGWFAEGALPTDLSLGRVLPHQLKRMFEHLRDPHLPTDYD